ncbi:GGDEF domain-containing protein [uncultured Pseudodesulfovibrio sp.]|uniref:GGDEF domain-containing protein n=1 Tax=uncultured Pseudodesulfovibrio sp. TaxID=2035858 RepID=UPI0029C72098|nr:GGDEF domain-containing protein [uncultured Pseudodesulfovibrio sp.]
MTIDHTIIIGLAVFVSAVLLGISLILITRLRRQLDTAHKLISQLTAADELTGLPGRRQFFESFDGEIDRASRYGSELSLLVVDIDHFSRVNDTYGHRSGDRVLKEVARLLSANVRTSDTVARYGGEEFVVLLPSTGADEARQAAEKLRVVVEVNDMTLEGPKINVTISVGIADFKSVWDRDGNPRDDMIRAAGRALTAAKEAGRNRVRVHEGSGEKQFSLI